MEKGAYYHLRNSADEEEGRLAGQPDLKPRVIRAPVPVKANADACSTLTCTSTQQTAGSLQAAQRNVCSYCVHSGLAHDHTRTVKVAFTSNVTRVKCTLVSQSALLSMWPRSTADRLDIQALPHSALACAAWLGYCKCNSPLFTCQCAFQPHAMQVLSNVLLASVVFKRSSYFHIHSTLVYSGSV